MPAIVPIIGAAATIGGAVIASNGANRAAQTQAQAQQNALNQQQAQFNQTQQNIAPWLSAGRTALGGQLNLLGLGGSAGTPGGYTGGSYDPMTGWHPGTYSAGTPAVSASDAQQQAIDALKNSPLYNSLYTNGRDTLLNNAAATGGLRGGNTENALARFGSDTLSQVIQQQLAQLAGISNTGNASATNLGQLGQSNSNAQSQIYNQIGSSQAGGILGQAGIANNAINGIGTLLGRYLGQNSGLSGLSGSAAQTILDNPSIF